MRKLINPKIKILMTKRDAMGNLIKTPKKLNNSVVETKRHIVRPSNLKIDFSFRNKASSTPEIASP
jgi:hypothetical protein